MKAVTISPHNDDAVLFAAFPTICYRADVVTVLRSQVQEDRGSGITASEREREDVEALDELDALTIEQWSFLDSRPEWEAVAAQISLLAERYDVAIAPWPEEGGHDQHNMVGEIVGRHFATNDVIWYTTYTRHSGRTRGGGGFAEFDAHPAWIAAKHRALACYATQIREPTCRPWFLDDLREYTRHGPA